MTTEYNNQKSEKSDTTGAIILMIIGIACVLGLVIGFLFLTGTIR